MNNFQRDHPNTCVCPLHVSPLLKDVLGQISEKTIVNIIAATGLCPLNPYRVDYSKILDTEIVDEDPQPISPINNRDANSNETSEKKRYETAKSVIIELLPAETLSNLMESQGWGTCYPLGWH